MLNRADATTLLSHRDLELQLERLQTALGLDPIGLVILNEPDFPLLEQDTIFGDGDFILQARRAEVRALSEKHRQARITYGEYLNDSLTLFANHKRAAERRELYLALQETIELTQALRQLKNTLALIENEELKKAAINCFNSASNLTCDFFEKKKLDIHAPETTSERKWLTTVVNNITALCNEPASFNKRLTCSESFNAMPTYKPGWRSLQQNGFYLLAAVILPICAETFWLGMLLNPLFFGVGGALFATMVALEILIRNYGTEKTDNELLHRRRVMDIIGQVAETYRYNSLFSDMQKLDKTAEINQQPVVEISVVPRV
jgi:hypothetical protein